MKQKFTILILTCVLGLIKVNAQNLPTVCSGSKVRYGTTGNPGSVFNWEILGGIIFANYNDSIDVLWNSAPGLKTIKVTENVKGGCLGETRFGYVIINSAPKITLGNEIKVCLGQKTDISPQENFKTYQWSNGETSKSISVANEGWYKLKVTDDVGCVASDSVYVALGKTPAVYLGNDTSLCGSTLILDAGTDGTFYNWSTSEITQTIEVGEGPKEISVQVSNDFGCVGSDTIKILACRGDRTDYEIPNTFTPNGDGDNDTWRIRFLEKFPNASVEVYDRWGRMVFQAKQGFPSKGWDGTNNGKELPMDSYYYIIKRGDGSDPKTGNVTIIR